MSSAKGIVLCAAVFLCTAAQALARTDRPNLNGGTRSPRVYGTFAHCSPSNRMDWSRLQPGEIAILEQDRGYREGIGLPPDAGECW